MPAPTPERDSAAARDSSWWNPRSKSWQSPWSLDKDEDEPAPTTPLPPPARPVVAPPTTPVAPAIAPINSPAPAPPPPPPAEIAPPPPAQPPPEVPAAISPPSEPNVELPVFRPRKRPADATTISSENSPAIDGIKALNGGATSLPAVPAPSAQEPAPLARVPEILDEPPAFRPRKRAPEPALRSLPEFTPAVFPAPPPIAAPEPLATPRESPEPPLSSPFEVAAPSQLAEPEFPATDLPRRNSPALAPSAEPFAQPELPPQIGEWPPRRRLPQPPRRSPWSSLLFFSLFVFAFTVIAWVYWQDEPLPSEETLALDRKLESTEHPAAMDRMRVLLTSVAPVQSAEMAMQPPYVWDTPALARMVDANGITRENLKDLLEDPDWRPKHTQWFGEDLGIHSAWTSLTILKQAECAYLMRRGEEEAAFDAAIDLAVLARQLKELHAWPSYYDRALQMHERACQSLADLLRHTKLGAKRLADFQAEFDKCGPDDALLRSALGGFYLFEKKLMLGPESREPLETLPGGIIYQRPGRLSFKVGRTLQLFVQSFRDLQDDAARSPYTRSNQVGARLAKRGPAFGLPNSAGESYFSARMAAYVSLPERQSIAHARQAVVTTLFAIRRFIADTTPPRRPPKLLNLRPEYLAEIPRDPFTGDLLKYDSATGLVSSVGTNFIPDILPATETPLANPKEIAAEAPAPVR